MERYSGRERGVQGSKHRGRVVVIRGTGGVGTGLEGLMAVTIDGTGSAPGARPCAATAGHAA